MSRSRWSRLHESDRPEIAAREVLVSIKFYQDLRRIVWYRRTVYGKIFRAK